MSSKKSKQGGDTPHAETHSVSTAQLEVEVTELIDVMSSQLISFVLPPFDFDHPVKTIEDVIGYTYEVETRHQISVDYFFRLIVTVDCTIHCKDDEDVKASVQSVTSFKALIPVDENRHFTLGMLPPKAVRAAAHIAYSTTRGLLIAKSSGTLLQKAVLPVVSSSEIVTAMPSI